MSTAKAATAAKKASAKMASVISSEHPPVAKMVTTAVSELDDSKGSSLVAIKKYILANFNGIDMIRAAPLIRRFLKKAVDEGVLTQKKNSYRPVKDGSTAKKPTTSKKTEEKKTKTMKPAKTVIRKPIPKKTAKATPVKKMPAKKMAAVKMTKKSPMKKTIKKPAVKKMAKKVTKK